MFLYLTLSGRLSDPVITFRKLHMMTMTRKCIVLLTITDPEETEKSLNPDATGGCLNNSRPHSNYYDSSSAFRSTSQLNNKKQIKTTT